MSMQDVTEGRPQRARGAGRLAVKQSAGRSRIDLLFQEGCAKIRLPDTYDTTLEAVLINTSGGLTGGDRMNWQVEAGCNTDVTVTTQACERIYKAVSGAAEVETHLRASAGSRLSWLPQETILFDHGHLNRRLDVDLDGNAEFLAVEAVVLGRTAMGELVNTGLFRDRWRVRRDGRLIHAEESRLDGAINDIAGMAAVLAGNLAFATLLYCGPYAESFVPKIQAVLSEAEGGVSHWEGKLIVRVTAVDGFALRKVLIPVISLLRNGAALPKVWNL
jgi:urease accessory protein